MIQIPRTTVRALRRDIRRALEVTSAKRAPAVTLRIVKDLLVIQATTDHVAYEFRLPYPFTAASDFCLTVPNEVLRACEGRTQEAVTFERQDDQIVVQWLDSGIPKKIAVPATSHFEMPQAPGAFHSVDPRFLPAMAEAARTTTKEESRFAMNCIRLRGPEGQIAATDTYQALIQTGFQFPWTDEILLRSSRALESPDFLHAHHVEIGRTDDWLFIRLEQQTLALRIDKDRRFPNVDLHVPTEGAAATMLQLSSDDATFLTSFVHRLPGAMTRRAPVTVELNGVVAIRATDDEDLNPVELILDHSRRDGDELRFQTDRTYLSRAAQLGFRDIHLRNAEAPAFCRDQHRTYVWALLGEEGIIPANDAMPKIHSDLKTPESFHSPNTSTERPTSSMSTHTTAADTTASRQGARRSRATTSQPVTKDSNTAAASPSEPSDEESTPSLLTQAETLRDSLTQALSDARNLISLIRRNQKQNRLVETTLRSLKQLEHIAS